MPYTTITKCASKIPVTAMNFAAITNWTFSANSGNPKMSKSASAETATITIPFCPEIDLAQFGLELTSIIVPITIGVASLTSYSWTLYESDTAALNNVGGIALPAATTITQTDNGAITTESNPTAFTITPSTVAFENLTGAIDPHEYYLVGSLVCPSSTTLAVYAATVNYNKVK